DTADPRHTVERGYELHLGRAGIHEAHVESVGHQCPEEAFSAVHLCKDQNIVERSNEPGTEATRPRADACGGSDLYPLSTGTGDVGVRAGGGSEFAREEPVNIDRIVPTRQELDPAAHS